MCAAWCVNAGALRELLTNGKCSHARRLWGIEACSGGIVNWLGRTAMPGVTWRKPHPVLVLGLSLAHAVLVGMLGAIESPNADEIGHLAAGISIWELGRCDRYCVNPPLVRTLAAIPVLACRPATSWRDEPRTSPDRSSGVSVSSSLNATDGSVHRGISPLLVGRVFRSVSWVVGCATGGLAIFTVAQVRRTCDRNVLR